MAPCEAVRSATTPKNTLSQVDPRVIRFLHPAYQHPLLFDFGCFLTLARSDGEAGQPGVFGVHHRTAHVACAIVANNAFNGYLSSTLSGDPVATGIDEVLTDNEYYFIVPGIDNYPVVPSFGDWAFPHRQFDAQWPNRLCTPLIADPPLRCAVTRHSFAIEKVHLVPQEHQAWFDLSEMSRYTLEHAGSSDIEHSLNIVPLKSDLHRAFDARYWTIAPKPVDSLQSPTGSAFAVHVLHQDNPAAEVHAIHHNMRVLTLGPDSKAFVFARFAWAVIQRVKLFVTAGYERRIVKLYRTEQGTPEWKTETFSGAQLKIMYSGGGSKGATPRKRSKFASAAESEADSEVGEDDKEQALMTWESALPKRTVTERWIETLSNPPVDPTELSRRLQKLEEVQRKQETVGSPPKHQQVEATIGSPSKRQRVF